MCDAPSERSQAQPSSDCNSMKTLRDSHLGKPNQPPAWSAKHMIMMVLEPLSWSGVSAALDHHNTHVYFSPIRDTRSSPSGRERMPPSASPLRSPSTPLILPSGGLRFYCLCLLYYTLLRSHSEEPPPVLAPCFLCPPPPGSPALPPEGSSKHRARQVPHPHCPEENILLLGLVLGPFAVLHLQLHSLPEISSRCFLTRRALLAKALLKYQCFC